MLCTLNLHKVICQLHLNKAGNKRKQNKGALKGGPVGTRKGHFGKVKRRGEKVLKAPGNSSQKAHCTSGTHQRSNSFG